MRPVPSAAQVRELDRRLIHEVGVPGIALMESASAGVARSIVAHHGAQARQGVVVVCGAGNNGGDGYGIARWLHGWGVPVAIWSLSEASQGDAAVMRAACDRLGIRACAGLDGAGLIVDAVFGTGLTREVSGRHADVIRLMAAHAAQVVAVDLPSGLSADTGEVLGVCAPAARTVTLGRLKPGLFGEPGADLVGVVEVVDIGLDCVAEAPYAEVPDASDLRALWPRRSGGDYKNRSGHLLVIAGSANMTGAAILTCRGALAAGVGLITLLAPRGALARLAALPPEVMVVVSSEGDRTEELPDAVFADRDAVAVGPGLGGGGDLPLPLQIGLRRCWRELQAPVVFDADALPYTIGEGRGPRVVTPHPGEASRMLDRGAREQRRSRFEMVEQLARGSRVAMLKGRHTLIAQQGHPISVNPTGHPVLATGGTGDVLTGVVGALLARGLPARDAARLAAWVHGAAGERLASRRSQGWAALDVALELPAAVEELLA